MRFNVYVLDQAESIKSSEVRKMVRAVKAQVKDDFCPAWDMKADVLYAKSLEKLDPKNVDALVYLKDKVKDADYAGYHDKDARTGVSLGYVFFDVSDSLEEDVSVTLSHEILEILGNRHVNYYALGPHPTKERIVFHWLEMCDAVQANSYKKEGVLVSDFLLPTYFTSDKEVREKNHFLSGKLESFGVMPGGYVGFFDPKTGRDSNFFSDKLSKERFKIKGRLGKLRRRERIANEFKKMGKI